MRSVILFCLLGLAASVPVDNGVEGDPEIECGPTSITVNFNTRNAFEGHVYVKGLYDQQDAGCRNSDGGRQVAGIELDFSTCNTKRARSLNPKGVFVETTVIVSFHPLFITKVDRAYKIQCFYMEADKTVDTRLEVSMLTTEFQTQVVPMPVCRYELLDGGPDGGPIEFAIVGQPIYHKWTCDTETVDTFCMVVHSCFVDDTNGDQVDLIDPNGCAADLYLVNNLEYPSDLMAGVEAHVFKYADRADLYFQCQITILVKEPGQTCPRPMCPSPAGRGAGEANPQLGPIQNPPQHPFPLISGSPYLPGGPGPRPSVPDDGELGEEEGLALDAVDDINEGIDDEIPVLKARDPGFSFDRAIRRGKRSERSVADAATAAGTMDVHVDLNTLDMAIDNNSFLPSSLLRSHPSLVDVSSGALCFGESTYHAFVGLAVLACMSLLVVLTYYVVRWRK